MICDARLPPIWRVQVTEKLLNHVSGTTGGIVAVYQRHAYQDEMRAAMDLWERHVGALLLDGGAQTGLQMAVLPIDVAA